MEESIKVGAHMKESSSLNGLVVEGSHRPNDVTEGSGGVGGPGIDGHQYFLLSQLVRATCEHPNRGQFLVHLEIRN